MSEIHGAVGSYVLNALDPSELDEFEAHLAVCPTCSREVVEFCETAAELSLLATAAAPPPELRGSILAAIGSVRVLPPILPALTDDEPDTVPSRPRRALELVEGPAAEPTASPPEVSAEARPVVDELALRRQQRRTRILTGAVAAVMVVALALGGVVYSLVQSRSSQVAEAALETQLFSAPDVHFYPTRTTNGGRVTFVASKQLNRALFVADSLPSPGANRTYQLWTVNSAKTPVPDNVVSGSGTVKSWFSGDVTSSIGVAVSIEPAGGSKTGTPTDVQKLNLFTS
jgi:hypothetical protein